MNNIVDMILQSNKIAILYHVNGDGDAVGSSLALFWSFRDNAQIDIFAEEHVAHNLQFLPGSDKIVFDNFPDTVYDLAIAVDCGDAKRLGKRIDIFNSAKSRINIDHHNNNSINGDINLVNVDASSSGEIIYRLLKDTNTGITKEISECLYTAIATDTGNFKHSNTTPDTHRIVAELLECGVKSNEIHMNVYENIPYARLKLLGKILDSMEICNDGKITLMSTDYNIVSSLETNFEELENIANYGLSVSGVELSMFIKEIEAGHTRVSMRSKHYFDCSNFAKSFNGGGHVRAAGCDIEGTKEDAKRILLEKVKEFGI